MLLTFYVNFSILLHDTTPKQGDQHLGGIPMNSITIPEDLLLTFAKQTGTERAKRLIQLIEENAPALLKAFADKNGLPVDTAACPTDNFTTETLRTAEAAVMLIVIQELQKHLQELNVPNFQTDNHDHGHGGCKCGGNCNCGGHGGCKCGGHDHDTHK